MDIKKKIENVIQDIVDESVRSKEVAQLTIKIPEDLNKRLTYMSAYLDTTKIDIISSALDVFLDVCEDKYNLKFLCMELNKEQLEKLRERYNASYFDNGMTFEEYAKEAKKKSFEYFNIIHSSTPDEFKEQIKKLKDNNKSINMKCELNGGRKYEVTYPIIEDLTTGDNEQ